MEYPDLFALCSRAFQAFDKDNTGHIPAKVWWKLLMMNYLLTRVGELIKVELLGVFRVI